MVGRAALLWAAAVAAAAGLAAGAWLSHSLTAPLPRMEDPAPATPTPRPAVHAAQPGEAMPAFSVMDLDGKPVSFPGDHAGKPLLINVWASWCGPCVEEMPELARYASQQGDSGPQVIGLALDTPEAVREFLTRVPVDYPIVLDSPGPADASVSLGNTQGLLPYTVLLDTQGRIVKQKLGPFKAGEIEGWAK